jgi:SAM-dependent methyltransferase
MKVEISIPSQGKHCRQITGSILRALQTVKQPVQWSYTDREEKPLDHAKNAAALHFLQGECDYLWMIDDDQYPACDDSPLDLVHLDKDIIALPTLYWSKKGQEVSAWPWMFNVYDFVPAKDHWQVHVPQNGLQECDAVGAGCTFYHRRVFEKVWPFFDRPVDENGLWSGKGPDLLFCRRAKEAGFRVWAHFDYLSDHIKSMSLLQVFTTMAARDVRNIPRVNRNTPEYWDAAWVERPERILPYYEWIADRLKGKRVLDYGCGRGDLLALLSEQNPGCVGVDISERAVEICRERGLTAVEVESNPGLVGIVPNAGGKWDAVVCCEVLEHLDDDEALIARLFELAPHVIIAVPHDCMPPAREPEHRRVYTEGGLKRLVPGITEINKDFEPWILVEAKQERENV